MARIDALKQEAAAIKAACDDDEDFDVDKIPSVDARLGFLQGEALATAVGREGCTHQGPPWIPPTIRVC